MPLYAAKIRVNRENYIGFRSYFATICCAERHTAFADLARGKRLVIKLLECSARHKFTMHAYCVMPDHLHMVVQGADAASHLLKFVDNFKQRTGFEYHQGCGQWLWQSRFYDHILRRGDHLEDVASYIWWNPVRAGLCRNPKQYPLSGSQTIAWMQWESKTTVWNPPWKDQQTGTEESPG
jgi:putative transposase